ncbi:S-adenosyl-L-methionine-dependent methyltransferase [Kickxella alabastrina]|uniref:S-adenosyl-L-methionine-dependent methyltransferase n=1 Tax=Kickxella alabastrina TaxID=61397 RepID=UPI00221E486D|nr:S-adenosyl-L-methionine-dependent methyltransferase [Kickxella alabastrina]KAI7832158.1 S-adenosyl-L-methionine-dependent methyltransferase [Kickxella alabastrina]KAJ1946634.1 hypothetical protein GGF37_001048 [Kickxella alabastrina]
MFASFAWHAVKTGRRPQGFGRMQRMSCSTEHPTQPTAPAPAPAAPADSDPEAFQPGDMVLLRDCTAPTTKLTLLGPLAPLQNHGTRHGILPHALILGQHPRARVSAQTTKGPRGSFMLHRPTLAEYTLHCARKCTPIYPKDSAAITAMLDLTTGDRVLEAGTGNAALTLALARAVGPHGAVHTVERHPETRKHAEKLVAEFDRARLLPAVRFHTGDVADVGPEIIPPGAQFDGIVLDMPTPWTQLPALHPLLKTDRYAVCYLPSMTQVVDLVRECRAWPLLVEDVVEVAWREWDVREAAVRGSLVPGGERAVVCRPTHAPLGHTAFLVKLRKCAATKTTEKKEQIKQAEQIESAEPARADPKESL